MIHEILGKITLYKTKIYIDLMYRCDMLNLFNFMMARSSDCEIIFETF